ncbi:MAG: hypothetical protein ACPGRC_07470 [Salibacteraceae bacterium]
MMRKIITLLLVLATSMAYSQEHEHEELKKNLLTGAFGYTYIPKAAFPEDTDSKGILVPSIGLDYFRRINKNWEVGTMIDLELANYLIVDRDLNRDKALVITAICAYSFNTPWTVYAGGGIELEKHENLGVIRMGGERVFSLKNDWVIAPGFFYDFKGGSYDTWSIAIAFGKEF